jgi:transposase
MFRDDRGNKKLNNEEKGSIIAFVDAGWSNKRICRRTGFSKPTVLKWRRRFEETGRVTRQVGSGRRKSTTPEEDERIRQAVIAKPITTAQEIAGLKSLIQYSGF